MWHRPPGIDIYGFDCNFFMRQKKSTSQFETLSTAGLMRSEDAPMSDNDNASVSESRNNANANNNQQSDKETSIDVRESTQDQQSTIIDTLTTVEGAADGNHNSEAVAADHSLMENRKPKNDSPQEDEGPIDEGDIEEVDIKSMDPPNPPADAQNEEFVEVQLSDGEPKPPEGIYSFQKNLICLMYGY